MQVSMCSSCMYLPDRSIFLYLELLHLHWNLAIFAVVYCFMNSFYGTKYTKHPHSLFAVKITVCVYSLSRHQTWKLSFWKMCQYIQIFPFHSYMIILSFHRATTSILLCNYWLKITNCKIKPYAFIMTSHQTRCS